MKLYFLAPLLFQKLIWIPTRIILTVFGHLHIQGLENLNDQEGPVIFAANHSSEIDPFVIPASLPFGSRFSPLFYATREKKFYNTNGWRKHLFGGLFINAWGGYTVNTGLRDYEKSLANHISIARDGGSFCIYPEGGITPDGNIQPARGGVAYLAERARCTIVPVAVSGIYKTSIMEFFFGRRHLNVYFGQPITQKELREEVSRKLVLGQHVYKEEANYIMEKVGKLMG